MEEDKYWEQSLILIFKENKSFFNVLIESEIFNTKNGNVTFHFDSEGILRKVTKDSCLYKK